MAALLDLMSFLIVLTLAFGAQPQPAQENVSPIINMQLDSRRKLLTWNYLRNVSEHECIIDTPPDYSVRVDPQVTPDLTYECAFPNAVLHRGATVTLNVTCAGDVFQQVLTFANPGREGSGAANFSCLVYNVRFMNCSWAPGPAAPADVQYRLFSWASRHAAEVECGHYIVDAAGTRVGCHFDQLGKPHRTDNYFFLLNGTSRETQIPFLDFTPFNAVKIEKYDPPAEIRVAHNGSHFIIRWENPEIRFDLSSHMLCYELDVHTAGTSAKTRPVFQRGQDSNVYLMPSSAARAQTAFRARVRYVHNPVWSAWSPSVRVGLREQDFSGALPGILVGVTASSALLLLFFCKRFSVRRRLLPPIPQVKKEIAQALGPGLEVAWEAGPPPGSPDPEDVVTLEGAW